jgi:hypothetical protein
MLTNRPSKLKLIFGFRKLILPIIIILKKKKVNGGKPLFIITEVFTINLEKLSSFWNDSILVISFF